MDNINLINEEKKSEQFTKLNLGDKQEYLFPVHTGDDMFKLKDKRSKSEIRKADRDTKRLLKQDETGENIEYKTRRTHETDDFRNMSSRLIKDKKGWKHWWSDDDPEMKRVKFTLNYLNNILDGDVSKYVKQAEDNEYIDSEGMKADINLAFDEVIKACNNYMRVKKAHGQAKHGPGIRRYNKVLNIRNRCETERLKYDSVADSIQTRSLVDYDVNTYKTKSPREMSALHRSSIALESIWQNEGNSTDVYRIKVRELNKENGEMEERYYYIKENLPLISADITGFLDRRTLQLEKSREAFGKNDDDHVEDRMKKNGMQDKDYKACIGFLGVVKSKIDSASDADKQEVKQRCSDLFAHDFDDMFIRLHNHNMAVRYMEEEEKGGSRKNWEEIAKDPENELAAVAQLILQIRKEQEEKPEGEKKDQLKKMNALEWVENELKLDQKKDSDLIKELKKIRKEQGDDGLENLFRVSLGKEVELFGQMRDRMKGNQREVAAANNTGTFMLAKTMGLTDIVTESDTRIVRFTNRNGEVVERFCTVTKEAVGKEFVQLMKDAKKENKKIVYSPEAVRQLTQLYMFDVACLQVDRHGRNFKCDSHEEDGQIVIDKIMSYDHDMSFGEENLKDAFTNPKTGAQQKKGFLPTLNTVIKKDSSMYRYVKEKYFGFREPKIFNNIKEPQWRINTQAKSIFNSPDKMDMLLFYGIRGEGRFFGTIGKPGMAVPKEYTGNVYRKPKDAKLLKEFEESKDAGPGSKFDKYILSDEEKDAAAKKLLGIIDKLKNLLVETDNKKIDKIKKELKEKHKDDKYYQPSWRETSIKKEFTTEQKIEIIKALQEMDDLNAEYDFRYVKCGFHSAGMLDLFMQQIKYAYMTAFSEDRTLLDRLTTTEKEYSQEEKRKRDVALAKLTDDSGNIVVPSLLHYDLRAYQAICNIAENKDPGRLEADLKTLNFGNEKIEKIKERCRELKTFLEDARDKAGYFYTLAGWENDPVKGKFFLDGTKGNDGLSDYDKIGDLSEMAVDPGNTYLSIDNEKFLFGSSEYREKTSAAEDSRAMEEEKKKHHDPKRWNDPTYCVRYNDNDNLKEFYNNPLSGRIHKAAPAA